MWPTPDGSSRAQFEERLSNSKRFSVGLSKAPMTRFQALTAHWTTMLLPSITFGLGLTFMDQDQLDTIQKPMMNAILPKMGYSSKTCRDVVFGPRKHLGIGARDLATERGAQQTLLHPHQTLFQIGLERFQLPAGITRPILECPDLKIPCLEVGWFRALQNFLCLVNAKRHLEMGRVPQFSK
jgi:hypothetical protein